jgi:hypothetical protein
MAGPWEDFQSSGSSEGPWSDFQASAPIVAKEASGPWQDFAKPQAQAPTASLSNPGVFDYLSETGKSFARGGLGVIASELQGVAGQIYEPDTSKPIPAPPPGGYRSEAEVPELPVLPVAQSSLYKAGEAVQGFGERTFTDRNILHPLARDVAGGFGSVATNIATSLVPGVRALTVPALLSQGAGEATERAVKAGATEDQIRRAASLGNIAGATEFVDVALPMLGTTGKTLSFLQKVGTRVALGAFAEGGQEGLQQFIQNMIAKGIYNPKQDLTQDVAYNALVGAIVGGGVGAVVPQRGATPEDPNAPLPPPAPTPPNALGGLDVETQVSPEAAAIVAANEPEIPAPPAPTVEEVKAKTLAPDIVEHIQKAAPAPLEVPAEPQQLQFDDLIAPTREEVQSAPGANAARLAKLLGPKLYGDPSDIAPVSVKELFQNSFDAIKGVLEKGQIEEGNIDINMDPMTRTISVLDDGSGMTPQVLGKQFLEIAGTQKETKRASGGLGIAKMLFIFGNKNLRVTSMREGKVSQLVTTGEELFSSLEDVSKAPKIQVRPATEADRRLFPKGHGTRVEVTVPKQYIDPTSGETRGIDFRPYGRDHKVLARSPLFDNINVRFNGEALNIGTQFPLEEFTQFTNLNADWGTARIYVTKNPDPNARYSNNAHVLSNGLWQFSTNVRQDPSRDWGENVAYHFYIDVNSKVSPEDQGYPFDLNRQQFSPQSRKAFDNLFKYMGLLYQQADLANSVTNFGSMQLLDYDAPTKSVKASLTTTIAPKTKPAPSALSLIQSGDTVKIVEGQLIVNGREVPELTPAEIAKFKINTDDFRIDQSEIDPSRVILHDNTDIEVSSVETRSVTEYGRERFGKRFDEFNFALGNAFKELRDIVVRYMPKEMALTFTTGKAKQTEASTNGYERLANEGIGISYDQEYRGVSIKLPFSAMFINPAVPEYTDPLRAAVGMVGTMVHELAHYKVRNHGAEFPAEMQRIIIMLDTNANFNFHAFKQKVINIVSSYEDVFNHMNGVFTSGDFIVRARGKRFEDSRSDEARDGSVSFDASGLRSQPESGARLSDWVAKSQTVPPAGERRGEPLAQTSPSRSSGPSDNGRGRNYASLRGVDPGITAPPQQPEVSPIRQGVNNVLGGTSPPAVKEAAAHADRMNWFYKWFAGLTELLDANPLFAPLRRYVERVRAMHSDETKIHDAALRIMKEWRGLGEQAGNLNRLILDVQAMPYLTPGERNMALWRHPTQAEFDALVVKHKISKEARGVYDKIRKMDESFLNAIEQNAIRDATRRIQDPTKLAARVDEIMAHGRMARAQPFFPFTRFGRYYVMVKDAAGKIVSFETFEPKRFGGVTIKRAERYQQARLKAVQRRLPAGHEATAGVLPETAEPLIGMPTVLLQQMQNSNIGLTANQITAIQQIQQMRNPGMSLGQRAIYKSQDEKVPGYSLDLQRSFARYYFHGGRYFAKVKHSWALRGHIAEAQLSPGNKSGLIATYMSDHLQNTVLDARGDFGFFKGAIFLWAMGYVPAAATQNLTQTPMITLPFLAAKFGDVRATSALVKAMAQVSSFYRRGTYDNMTGFEMQALDYGIKTGRISETQAPELAGIASGGNLINGQGGSKLQRGAVAFQEKAAWMFEMAEQFNRRVAYRAALNLAQANPKAKFVNESVLKYQDEYKALLAHFGGNENQARAAVSAIHAVDQTQYVYARYARPRFMRGPVPSTLFVFKRYMQSTLLMLGHNKSDVLPRYLVMAMLMGGLGGVPGYDDMAGIFKAFAKWFFGKDVSVDRLVRSYVTQWFGKDSVVEPDLVLHGLARRGFGLPALVDMMGSFVTGNNGRGLSSKPAANWPYPILDRSKALSMGNILPVEVGKLLEPTDKIDKTIADQTQKASGAVWSVGFNVYKALMDTHMQASDPKRWERAVPRALGSVSRSYRAFSEGRERGKGGPNSAPTIIPYDVRDTEQMMEAIALAGGYQPLRQQAKWDSIIAKAEVTSFYDFKRKGLLEQYFEAQKGRNKEEIAKVRDEIILFNKELPDFAKPKVISGDTILRSMKGRERTLQSRESGIPAQKSNIGISRHIDALFPEATVDVRRVR